MHGVLINFDPNTTCADAQSSTRACSQRVILSSLISYEGWHVLMRVVIETGSVSILRLVAPQQQREEAALCGGRGMVLSLAGHELVRRQGNLFCTRRLGHLRRQGNRVRRHADRLCWLTLTLDNPGGSK